MDVVEYSSLALSLSRSLARARARAFFFFFSLSLSTNPSIMRSHRSVFAPLSIVELSVCMSLEYEVVETPVLMAQRETDGDVCWFYLSNH